MIRGIKEKPSIVAGLRDGNCVAVFVGDWNLSEDSMMEVCKVVEMYISQQLGAYFNAGVISWECQSSWNNRDWIVTFSKQGLIHPTVIPNSEEHLAAYSNGHLEEHQPVVMDLGKIRSLTDQRGDAPAQPRGATERDWAMVQEQMQQKQLALVADAREKVQDPEDPATTSTATATTP